MTRTTSSKNPPRSRKEPTPKGGAAKPRKVAPASAAAPARPASSGTKRRAAADDEGGKEEKAAPLGTARRPEDSENLVDRLAVLLGELPRAADFEPLAEHLYAFAQAAPALTESLRGLPEGIRALHEALAEVQETTSTLDYLHSSFSLAFLKLPSASDYEPLVAPLVQFARSSPLLLERLEETLRAVTSLTSALDERPPAEELNVLAEPARELALVAPALSEALSRLPPLVEPLTRSLSGLGHLAERMHAAAERMGVGEHQSRGPEPQDGGLGWEARDEALSRIVEAREAILEAVASLPRAEDYSPFAQQLREIATVSPSLLGWLRDVPAVSTPLVSSVRALLAAADTLQEARNLLGP